jgi:MFS family permease
VPLRRPPSEQAQESGRTDGRAMPDLPHFPEPVERVIESVTHNAARSNHGDPSVETTRAWLMAWAAFVAGFVVFGVTYSFGLFLLPMAHDFAAGTAAVSALFSIASLAFYMLGPIAGRLSDRIGPRKVVAAGAVAMSAGLALTAATDRMWVAWLTYGAGVGCGAACAYVPTLANVGGWFVTRRNTALGLAAAGTGCGMLVLPPLVAALIEHQGWRSAMIALALLCAVLLGLCALVVAPSTQYSTPLARRSVAAIVRARPFVLMYLSWLFATMALFVALLLLPATAVQSGTDQVAASLLLSLLGGASVLGRLGIGLLSKKLGIFPLFKISVLVMAVSYLIWLAAGGYLALSIFAIVLGTAYGIRIALVPSIFIEYFGQHDLGTVLGLFFTSNGIAALAAPLVAGLLGSTSGILLALVAGMIGFVSIMPMRAPR